MRRVVSPTLVHLALSSRRHLARKSTTQGPIVVEGSFVTRDITLGENITRGGTFSRAVFSVGQMGHGRELMNVPARFMYIGDEPLREQCLIVAREIFRELVTDGPLKPFVEARVLTMMSGGKSFFFRERDAEAFAESVPGGMEYISRHGYTLFDLQKLPMIVWFNRFDIEYNGRNGICLFPEVSYLNHSCEPNCELEIRRDLLGNYTCSVRACRPIQKGEELVLHYLPDHNLPLTRFMRAMRDRWAFECTCSLCKSRLVNCMIIYAVFIAFPFFIGTRYYVRRTSKERGRAMASTGAY